MRRTRLGGTSGKSPEGYRILGVSQAVGTVLLLSISVIMAGGVVLWTQQMEEIQPALYVDIWSNIEGNDLVLTHRGGDFLDGEDTIVIVRNQDGSTPVHDSYYSLSAASDETWSPGEILSIDISSVDNRFNLIITSGLDNGEPVVIFSETLIRNPASSGLPDLAVTMISIQDHGINMNTIYEGGDYDVVIRVDNLGDNMTDVYFQEIPGNRIANLNVFDTREEIIFSEVEMEHFDSTDIEITGGDFGILDAGDYMVFRYTWPAYQNTTRVLGPHTLNVKIPPYPLGELVYTNNKIDRRFNVNKEMLPVVIPGPNPGIYDIYFSNNAPYSGEEIEVTVVIQNSGNEPIEYDDDVTLLVSTWKPELMNEENSAEYGWPVQTEVRNWRVDKSDPPAYDYGDWRTDAEIMPIEYDTDFPTCTIPNIQLLPGAYFFFYFSLTAQVDEPGGELRVYACIDVFNTTASPQGVPVDGGDRVDELDNYGEGTIQVLPKILVLDDDEAVTGSVNDVTSSVLEALVGAGVNIDALYIPQVVEDSGMDRDAPAFEYDGAVLNAPSLSDYDIVIWVTGKSVDPFTNRIETGSQYGGNIQEMMKFMDAGKYLLIIGSSPLGRYGTGLEPDTGLVKYFDSGYTDQPNAGNGYSPLHNGFIEARTLARDYLRIARIETSIDLPEGADQILIGTDTGTGGVTPIPDGEPQYNISLIEQEADNNLAQIMVPYIDDPANPMTQGVIVRSLADETADRYIALRSWGDTGNETESNYRVSLNSWDLNQIEYLNEKINLIAGYLRWFDWEISVGRDLAITRLTLSIISESPSGYERLPINDTNVPKYLDTIEAEVIVRNNGPSLETSSVIFYITGPDGIELPISPGVPDPFDPDNEDSNPVDISGLGGHGSEMIIYKLWLAVGVGTYTFRVVVDPYHLISEVSEDNNDITYSTSTVTSFITQNNILIVDDDDSSDNWIFDEAPPIDPVIVYPSGEEPSDIIAYVLDNLSHIDEADEDYYKYEIWHVKNRYSGGWIMGDGPTISDIKRFNSVLWVTGESGSRIPDTVQTFTDSDITSIISYLEGDYPEAEFLPPEHYENLMVVGSRVVSDIAGNTPLDYILDDYLGVNPSAGMRATSSRIVGPSTGSYLDRTYVGMDYVISSVFEYEIISQSSPPNSIQSPGLYAVNGGSSHLISTQIRHVDPTLEVYFRTVTHNWQLTNADHDAQESKLSEMIYLTLHWFETPDVRPELIGRNPHLVVENRNPVIGNSYLVTYKIANMGGAGGGGTVRFRDGNTLIKSENFFIEPDQTATLEAIWKPLYAGFRTLSVSIDYYDDYDEIYDDLNNHPTRNIYVYYFWDDMENGAGNWRHDSTMLLINGESPLDYLDPFDRNPSTNISNEWDLTMSKDLNVSDSIFRSAPYSFQLEESAGAVKGDADVLAALVIDNSDSMARTLPNGSMPLDLAKIAAKVLVNELSDKSFVSLWVFRGNNPRNDLPLTTLQGGGREVVLNAIDNIRPKGGITSIWDSTGSAYMDIQSSKSSYPDLTPAVVVLSDGADYLSSDDSALKLFMLERGSNEWCPWHNMYFGDDPDLGFISVKYNDHKGKYSIPWDKIPGSWLTVGNGLLGDRKGLLNSNIPIYTVGLALEHNPDLDIDPITPDWNQTSTWIEGWTEPNHYRYLNLISDPGELESGTVEYNLWRISTTSDAEYFYAPNPEDLVDIFRKIGEKLASPTNQTRGGSPTRAEDVPNSDKWAVTQSLDLSDTENVYLTFWHKYNIVDGTNGAFIQIGYKDPTVDTSGDPVNDWDWKYAVPIEGAYSGSMYLGVDRYDSFGNRITWGWNGLSGEGTFKWEYVKIDVKDYVPERYLDEVKIKFNYTQYGGGTGYGWWFDDVKVVVSRADDDPVSEVVTDNWKLQTGSVAAGTTHSGTHAWFCGDPSNPYNDFKDGVDNSLYTRPIDLTNAEWAYFQASLKFNFDTDSGRPPDGFRMEISVDNGQTWISLSLGVRSSWSVSGTEGDAGDGLIDGKSFTGIPSTSGSYWVWTSTVSRINTDLTGFVGNVVILRFRLITNTDQDGHHDKNHTFPAGEEFRGLYVDDVIVYGQSLISGRNNVDPVDDPDRKKTVSESVFDYNQALPADPDMDGKPEGSALNQVQEGEVSTISGAILIVMFLVLLTAVYITFRRARFALSHRNGGMNDA
ncbi:MAG: type IV pilin [Thermoplasmatota archaeon]